MWGVEKMNADLFGAITTVLIGMSILPQLRQTYTTKVVDGLNIWLFSMLFIGVISLTIYGVLIRDFYIIVLNGWLSVAEGLMVFWIWRYRDVC